MGTFGYEKENKMKHVQMTMVLCVIAALCTVTCTPKKGEIERDEYNQILLFTEKNNDTTIKDKLILTVENVKDVIQYIKTNYPSFNFEEAGYKTDDASIASFVKNFNENEPEHCTVYIPGIKKFAGYSSVVSSLNGLLDVDKPELWGYYFYIDEEYSDFSGIMRGDLYSITEDSEFLSLWKRKYVNSEDSYWVVAWPLGDYDEDVANDNYEVYQLYTKEQKTAILTSFLIKLRETKVYQNLDMEWFEMVYTGIDGISQRIGDLLWEKPYEVH
jgi:hypothetical protein